MNATGKYIYKEKKMKIVKLTALFLTAAFLSGCAKSYIIESESDSRIISSFKNIYNHGELYSDDQGRLFFTDFGSMSTTVLCSKPNCTHADSEECSAFGMDDHPVLFGNSIFFFKNETVFEGDTVTETAYIYKANTDGTSRKIIATAKGFYEGASSDRMVLVGDTLYFCMTKHQFNEYGSTSGYDEGWLCKFNLMDEKLEIIEKIFEGYHSGIWLDGYWDEKIYFTYSAFDKELSDQESATLDKSQIYTYKTYDIKNGAVEESGQPTPVVYVGKGYYVYAKDNGLSVIDESGKEIYFEDFAYSGSFEIFDGKIFSPYVKKWGDIATGKAYALNVDSASDSILDYMEGNYIVRSYITENDGHILGRENKKISQKELLGQ